MLQPSNCLYDNDDITNITITSLTQKTDSDEGNVSSLKPTNIDIVKKHSSKKPSIRKSRSKTKISSTCEKNFLIEQNTRLDDDEKEKEDQKKAKPKKVQTQTHVNIIDNGNLQMNTGKELELLETYRNNPLYAVHILNRLRSAQMTSSYRQPRNPEQSTGHVLITRSTITKVHIVETGHFNDKSNKRTTSKQVASRFSKTTK